MSRFNAQLIGSSQCLALEIEADNLMSLIDMLGHQRFLMGRFAAELDDLALIPVMIPISRIQLLYEAPQ